MSKQRPEIDSELSEWIARQHIFFVATAPLSIDAHMNLSPKGGDSFRVLGPMEVAYQEYTGSGAETVAHLRENGRIIVMFCAFEGAPRVLRIHGRGEVIAANDPRFASLAKSFPAHSGTRSIIKIQVTRVSTSCGFAVPFFDFRARRETLDEWTARQGTENIAAYRALKNQFSIDGLPAFANSERLQRGPGENERRSQGTRPEISSFPVDTD